MPVAVSNAPPDIPPSAGELVNIGYRNNSEALSPSYFGGGLDEVSIYNRALSASEIKAIYDEGANGKFDPTEFLISPPLSLAKAQVSINGGTPTDLFGNNTAWQTQTISFTATQSSTTLQIQGIEPGMLLDAPSVVSVTTNYSYLVFTENTNLTTTPIKFAAFPLIPSTSSTNVAASGFDSAAPGDYTTTFNDGTNMWNVLGNQVSVVNDPANADAGNHFLALANGTVSSTLPTVAGQAYVLTFRYRGPGIAGWWRGESNATGTITYDSVGANNGTLSGGASFSPGYVNADGGEALQFDGTNGVVMLGDPDSLKITNSFSIEGWVNSRAYNPIALILIRCDTRNCLDPYYLAIHRYSGPDFHVEDATSGTCGVDDTGPTDVPLNQWAHIAGTYDSPSGAMRLYVNGTLVSQRVSNQQPFRDLNPNDQPMVAIGNLGNGFNNEGFNGWIDELSIYHRVLSASEVKAIYDANANGKFDPTEFPLSAAQSLAEAQVSVGGGTPTVIFGDNNNWQTKTIVFTAAQNGTPLQITGLEPGMLLDSFSLSPSAGEVYYLPEQSLDDAFDGKNAQGNWTLEIQDDRVGATNPPPLLLSWQLRFNYVTYGTNAAGIPPGTTATNVIPAGGWAYIPVDVPNNADMATNILVFATGPLNMWFNANNNPNGGPSPPDWLLLGGATSGSSTLSTFSVPTNIVPGGVYYIGLYNPNAFAVTSGFQVNFHYFSITPVPPGAPITNVVTGTLAGDGVNYYSFAVPTNADYATNLLLFSTTPVNVWFNQSKAPVCLTPPDSLLIGNATNGVAILSATSTPPLLPGLTYYLAIQNTNGPDATNVLEVNFHYASILTNGVPVTNSIPTNSFVYYPVTVPTNADYATNLLLFATGPVNVWFNQNQYPTGTNPPDSLLLGGATNGTSVLSGSTTPPLVPGSTYYLGVQNTNSVPVTFGLQVNFHYVVPPPIISGLTITATNNGVTNGYLLTWDGPTNYQYTIQWTTNLAASVMWNTVLNPVINVVVVSTSGHYSWFDDGSLTGGWPPSKFYRVFASLVAGTITNATPVTNNIAAGSITALAVTVPASAIGASNLLVSATGPVNVYFNQANPPTGNTNAGDVLMLSAATGGNFLLTSNSLPPLVPGANYYLGLQNPGASNVTFVFQVIFSYGSSSNNPTTISSITFTNIGGSNGVLLTWFAPTNYQYQIQWTTSLAAPIGWTTIPGVVLTNLASFTPTNGIGEFQYFDNGSLTGGFGPLKFYRLIAYPPGVPVPPALVISSVLAVPGGLQIQWSGSTNYLYDIQWTTNLALPASSWIVISNLTIPVPLAYTNGVFTYTATNALTAGSPAAEFFRVLLLP